MRWKRIPAEIKNEDDRRTLFAVLAANGLAVREVKVRETNRGAAKRFVEFTSGAPEERPEK